MSKLNSILLVEDDDIVNFYNEFLLNELQVAENIHIAHNGVEALAFLKKCEDSPDEFPFPDLIFLDINMPLMNGFEFLDHYEQRDWSSKVHALVVMLTTSLHEADVKRASTYPSILEYVYKPLMQDKLESVIDKFFAKGGSES